MEFDISNGNKTNALSPTEQQELTALCNGLPEKLQRDITDVVSRTDFEYYQKPYFEFLNKMVPAFKAFLQSEKDPIILVLQESLDNPKYDFGRFCLPFLRAIAATAERGAVKISPELSSIILKFQKSNFSELYDSELVPILKHSVLFFLDTLDMVHQLKRRYVLDDARYIDDWGLDFLRALQQNEEVLGSDNLLIGGKVLPPFIQNWIEDFATALPTPVDQRSALEEAQYFAKSTNVAKLSAEEKKLLQELLQLYDWLLHPFATMAELEAYDAQEVPKESIPRFQPSPSVDRVVRPSQDVVKPVVRDFIEQTPTPPPSFVIPNRSSNVQDVLLNKKQRPSGAPSGVINPYHAVMKPPAEFQPVQKRPLTKAQAPLPPKAPAAPRNPVLDEIDQKLNNLKNRAK